MKQAMAGLVMALLLNACGQGGQTAQKQMDLMGIGSVEFLVSVAADAPLDIVVEVGWGCTPASPFGQFKVTRTATTLELQAFTKPYAKSATPLPPCPPIYFYEKRIYTDPGTPARTNPFEIIVNGNSWGKIEVEQVAANQRAAGQDK